MPVMVKKSQFKIQQMAFMLLALVLFFALVAVFWLTIKSKSLTKEATRLKENQAILISEFVSGEAEFSCGMAYCIDTDKLIVFENKSIYREFFPVSYIKIRKIYFWNETKDIECNKANYPKCNIFDVYENEKVKSKSSTSSFVALCRHEQEGRTCELGKINIGYEVK